MSPSSPSFRPRRSAAVAAVVLALSAYSCASERSLMPVYRTKADPRPAITPHVVVVSIDGLRPDAITASATPTLWRLVKEGSYSFTARTILPSKTLPSHTSMLTGVPPDVHKVTWNSDETETRGVVGVPTIFSLARARGLTTAAFFSKTKFQHLEIPGSLDHGDAPADGGANRMAGETIGKAERFLGTTSPSLLFVHIAEPDYAGHQYGWMGPHYRRAVTVADAGVMRLMAALDAAYGTQGYTLIVTADHGGHGDGHGSSDIRDVMIPWIAWGNGVAQGHALTTVVHTMDTAATALWLLGVEVPSKWAGAPVDEAFEN